MNNSFFSLFLMILPIALQAFDAQEFNLDFKTISSSSSSSLNLIIEKKTAILKEEASLLKQDRLWRKTRTLLQGFKNTCECQLISKLQEALTILNGLQDLSFVQPQQNLLSSISSFLQSPIPSIPPLRSFLHKERVRLMDNVDEAILLKTKQSTLCELKKELLEELQAKLKTIKQTGLYKKLQETHKDYRANKKTKKVLSLIDKIRDLEQEKSMLILTNKQCFQAQNKKKLWLTQTRSPLLLASFEPSFNNLKVIQLDLFMAPLEILIL